MILYLDTSALVKLYASEAGANLVRAAVASSEVIATSIVAYAEARSAFARKYREGGVGQAAFATQKREFDRDWSRLHRLPVDETTARRAGELAEQHALRGFDALHLASADSLQAVIRSRVTFACFDGALSAASAKLGMAALASAAPD